MKIAFVIEECNKQGGQERVVAELAERMCQKHEVHVFAHAWADVTDPRITFHRVAMRARPAFLILPTFHAGLRQVLRPADFDIVHGQGPNCLLANVVTCHTCHAAKIRAVQPVGLSLKERLARVLFDQVALAYERRTYAPAAGRLVIALSSGIKREVMEHYGTLEERMVVIPNGVDLEEFNPSNRAAFRQVVRRELGLAEEDFVLLFLGEDFERKGLRYAVESLSQVSDERVKLVVVGGTDASQSPLVGLAGTLGVADRLRWVGHTRSVNRYYATADAFVFPTAYEAFSLVSLEAAASGLPLLATRVNGTEELVRDGENGFFIERDGRDIAARVQGLANDPGLCERLGRGAAEAASGYGWGTIADKILECYRECMERPASGPSLQSEPGALGRG